MNDDLITALARKYAEEMCAHMEDDFIKDEAIRDNELCFQMAVEHLSRRFCIVEKSKFGEAYFMVKNKYDNAESPTDMDLALAQKEILDFIIPEITKEVEG